MAFLPDFQKGNPVHATRSNRNAAAVFVGMTAIVGFVIVATIVGTVLILVFLAGQADLRQAQVHIAELEARVAQLELRAAQLEQFQSYGYRPATQPEHVEQTSPSMFGGQGPSVGGQLPFMSPSMFGPSWGKPYYSEYTSQQWRAEGKEGTEENDDE